MGCRKSTFRIEIRCLPVVSTCVVEETRHGIQDEHNLSTWKVKDGNEGEVVEIELFLEQCK